VKETDDGRKTADTLGDTLWGGATVGTPPTSRQPQTNGPDSAPQSENGDQGQTAATPRSDS
jgi:hypothetical protein